MTRKEKMDKIESVKTIADLLIENGPFISQVEFNNHIKDMRQILFTIQDVSES